MNTSSESICYVNGTIKLSSINIPIGAASAVTLITYLLIGLTVVIVAAVVAISVFLVNRRRKVIKKDQ